jgi:hypothetical protein
MHLHRLHHALDQYEGITFFWFTPFMLMGTTYQLQNENSISLICLFVYIIKVCVCKLVLLPYSILSRVPVLLLWKIVLPL